jgi:hypothetical protein
LISVLARLTLLLAVAAAPANPSHQDDTPAVPPPMPAPAFVKQKARSYDEAKQDPRFVRRSVEADARVRITRTLDGYPYYGIPDNGCSQGKNFFTAELLANFDELPAGTTIVLRIEDATIGPASTGSTLAFSGMRRAGKGPDGTPVYCGRGSAFQIRGQ